MGRMKLALLIGLIAGVLVSLGVVAYVGFDAVLAALARLGWSGFATLIACQLALVPLLGGAWFVLARGQGAGLPTFAWGRLVRDSATEVLPFSPLGGLLLGARAASLHGLPGPVALGSAVVDVTAELLAQIAYTLLGLVLLLSRGVLGAHGLSPVELGAALLLAPATTAGFILFQRRGLGFILRHMEARWSGAGLAKAEAAHAEILAIYDRPWRVCLSVALHFAAWIAAALGAWIGLRLLGADLSFADVVALESLLCALRSAAFVVPGGLGVQEGAYALLAALFGLPVEIAVALSLVKRARDLMIGVPALLAWQVGELRRAG